MKQLLLVLLICCLPAVKGQNAVGPGDWSSIRLYGHAYNVNDFSDEEYEWIANHNQLFTIEKRHAKNVYGDISSERASVATAAKIVANNSAAQPLFYWNTKVVYDYIYETIEAAVAEHPEWNNDGNWTYEDPEFRTWYVDVVKDMVNNQGHSGVFLDGALSVAYWISQDAHDYLEDMIAEMPGTVIFNGFGPNSSTARFEFLEVADGVFCEHFFRAQCDNLVKGQTMIDDLLKVSNDKIIIANSQPNEFWETTDHKFSLAAYLIIANDNSYYHYFSQELYASEYMMYWHSDFEQNLGAPLDVASKNGYVYTRTFENASVMVDLENKTSSITWIENPVNEVEPIENLAVLGTATQSSTNYSGEASRAIDGDTNGAFSGASVTHTESGDKPWWQVDLGATYSIGDITIYNRTDDCCVARLSDFTVYVLDEDTAIVDSVTFMSYPDPSITMDAAGVKGRFVKIELNGNGTLCLAEVQVAESKLALEQQSISVKVVDDSSNDGIALASLEINKLVYTTNFVGDLVFDLPQGEYPFTLTQDGYESLTQTLIVTSDTSIVLQLEAIPQYSLLYKVTDVSTNSELSSVAIQVGDEHVSTDDSGEAAFLFTEGVYVYSLTNAGYISILDSLILTKDTTLVVQMDRESYTLTFQVKDPTTTDNISSTSITIQDSIYETDAEGELSLSLKFGTYDYVVSKEGYDTSSGSIYLMEDSILTVVLSAVSGVLNQLAEKIDIFPSPVTDILMINSVSTTNAKYEIFNITGELVKLGELSQGDNTIDVADLLPGIYIISVIQNEIATCSKVLKCD